MLKLIRKESENGIEYYTTINGSLVLIDIDENSLKWGEYKRLITQEPYSETYEVKNSKTKIDVEDLKEYLDIDKYVKEDCLFKSIKEILDKFFIYIDAEFYFTDSRKCNINTNDSDVESINIRHRFYEEIFIGSLMDPLFENAIVFKSKKYLDKFEDMIELLKKLIRLPMSVEDYMVDLLIGKVIEERFLIINVGRYIKSDKIYDIFKSDMTDPSEIKSVYNDMRRVISIYSSIINRYIEEGVYLRLYEVISLPEIIYLLDLIEFIESVYFNRKKLEKYRFICDDKLYMEILENTPGQHITLKMLFDEKEYKEYETISNAITKDIYEINKLFRYSSSIKSYIKVSGHYKEYLSSVNRYTK